MTPKKKKMGPAPGTVYSQIKRPALGEKIFALRREKGLSQTDLAKKTGLTKRTISFYETEGENVPVQKLELIAKALNVTLDEFTEYKPDRDSFEVSRSLLKRIELLKKLPPEKQKIVSDMIDQLASAK